MKNTIWLLLIFIISSGAKVPDNVKLILNSSGANRSELERVIMHYDSLGDTQKLKAAYFLIANIRGKRSEYYSYNELAYNIFNNEKEAYKDKRTQYRNIMQDKIDSLKTISPNNPLVAYDIDVITAEYLIKNIDLAFKVWKEPWAEKYNFDEFCQYILPYRESTEPLSNWREIFYSKYIGLKKSMHNITDSKEMMLLLNDMIGKDFRVEDFLEIPFVPVTLLDDVRAGGCNQRYLLMVSLLRAMGIAAMIDYTPQNNASFKGHSWTVYIDSRNHKYYPFDGGRIRKKLFEMDALDNAFTNKMIIPLADGYGPCVFRNCYKIEQGSLSEHIKKNNTIPPYFRSNCLRNVSTLYEYSQKKLTWSISDSIASNDSIIYLSVFGYGKELREANWCMIRNKKISFDNTGTGIVYLLSTYKNKKLHPFTNPILLKNQSETIILNPNKNNKQKVLLTRKCKVSLLMEGYAKDMIGCIIEGSNDSTFSKSDTLFKIKDAPEFLVEELLYPKTKYRYIRYVSPKKEIHVAELQFIGKDSISENEYDLAGTPIIEKGIQISANPNNMFDHDIRTNYIAHSNSWIGIDLQKPQYITKIRYLPQNNFNEIEPDNKYELYYYDNGWKSLGIKTTKNQYLEYENVPYNSLLLLKNLSKGIEERIFTYEKGKQIWW